MLTAANRAAVTKMRLAAARVRTAKLLGARPGVVSVPCDTALHERLKLDPKAWQKQTLIGFQKTYDEPGRPTHLEMRNALCCGTTLCLPVTRTEAA